MKYLLTGMFFVYSIAQGSASPFLPESFSSDFEQVFVSTLTGKEKKSKGIIEYKYPGNIRFEVLGPEQTVFVANPKKSWYYTPPFATGEQGEVVIQPSGKLILSKFFDVLKEGLKSNSLYGIEKKGESYELIFTKDAQEKLKLAKATMFFKKAQSEIMDNVEKIILERSDKKTVTLKFSNFKRDVSFAKDHFVFSVPKNTRITDN